MMLNCINHHYCMMINFAVFRRRGSVPRPPLRSKSHSNHRGARHNTPTQFNKLVSNPRSIWIKVLNRFIADMNGGDCYRHVDVADIALLQLVSVRHPMANHLRGKGFLRIQFAAQRHIFWP